MSFVGSATAGWLLPAAIGGSALISGGLGFLGAQEASKTQANAAANSLAFQQQVWQTQQANAKPYLDVGKGATYTLGGMYGIGPNGTTTNVPDYSQFYNSPDYLFAQSQGNLAVNRQLAATGQVQSGGAQKAISDYNQGLASQQFGNYFQRLLSLSQLGNNAAIGVNQTGSQMASTIGQTTQAQGQAQASGIVGGTNALIGASNSIPQGLLLNQYVQNQNKTGYQTGGTGGGVQT
jgi:hypothetical protein